MFWVVILLTIAMGLVCLEVFIPSGGVLGFLAVSAVLAAVVLGFLQGPGYGAATLLTALVLLPAGAMLALRVLPHTPMGRRMMLAPPSADDVTPDSPRRRELKALLGKVGQAKTAMLPSGAISIEGRTITAQSDGTPIEPGQWVRVADVSGNRVVVRPLDSQPPPQGSDPNDLSRPIDALGLDPYADPLA